MAEHAQGITSARAEDKRRVAIAFLVLSWFFILLRIWTRTFVISNFGWDDSAMILAGMIFTVYCSAMLFIEEHGGGTHVTDLSQLVLLARWVIVGQATYLMTIMILKISLGIFFMRIVVKHWQVVFIYVTVGVNIISSIAAFFYVLFRCGSNLDIYVYKQIAEECTPRVLDRFFAYQQASFTTLTDFFFAILPIFLLWNASMDTRAKVSVGIILSLAALGCVCSIIRFQYVDGLTEINDFFWNAVNVAIWSTIEPGAGIIAGCLATLRPLLKIALVRARSIKTGSSFSSFSVKRLSRSFRSNENSANQKSVIMSSGGTSNLNAVQPVNKEEPAIEMKSDVRRGESSDLILPRRGEADGPWPAHQEESFDLERRVTPQTRSTWIPPHPAPISQLNRWSSPAAGNAWSARDRAVIFDRPLPPLPPHASDLEKGQG